MAQRVSQTAQDKLTKLKKLLKEAEDYWSENLSNYHIFRNFIFDTTLSEEEKNKLTTLKKPILEFNVSEAYISRLIGEWSKQTASFIIHSENDTPTDIAMVEFVRDHLKLRLGEANSRSFSDEIYKEALSGGYSAMEVLTDYKDTFSFDQNIYFSKPHSPTQCGWDPLARDSHKGDGRFVYKKFPLTKEAFKEEYPDIEIDELLYTAPDSGFAWSYMKGTTKVVMVVDFYLKTTKFDTLYFLSDGRSMPRGEYTKMAEEFNLDPSRLDVLPEIKKKRRIKYDRIERYRMIENEVIEYTQTEYEHLPIIFVDGNSAYLSKYTSANPSGDDLYQKTRPYFYNAIDAQRLMNFSAQSLAAELENIVMHKIMASERSIPDSDVFKEAWLYPQIPSTFVYKDLDDENRPINPPVAAPRQPIPPELYQTFTGMDQKMQTILGSYDASLGINNNQLSGIAIVEGATQSNNAAMPHVIHYLQALTRAGEVFVSLIPKYYVTPRTMPIITMDDRRAYVQINTQEGKNPLMVKDYSNPLHVEVTAGLNFEVQQNRALQFTTQMAQSFDGFKAMINAKGLPWLVGQLNVNGVEELREMAREFQTQMEEQQKEQQQAMASAQQTDPNTKLLQLEEQKITERRNNDLTKNRLAEAEFQLKERKQADERTKTQLRFYLDQQAHLLDLAQAEDARDKDQTALDIQKMKDNRVMINDLLKTLGD